MRPALAIAGALLLSGCASPVVTRIDAVTPSGRPAPASFAIAVVPGDFAPAHAQATDLVAADLKQRGWRQAGSGEYLLAVTVSDRPATAKLQAGDDAGKPQSVIAPAADLRTTKGCARRDYRLAVRLTNSLSGDALYSGSAAEFHCKAALAQTLPYLVIAALDGLDGEQGARHVERDGVR